MSEPGSIPLLLLAAPWAGALLSAFAWSRPRELKTYLLLSAAASLVAVLGVAGGAGAPTAMPFLCLLPIAAFVSLLGQPIHVATRGAWLMTVILLGIDVAILSSSGPAQWMGLMLLFVVLIGILARARDAGTTAPTWGLVIYGLGAVAAGLAAVAPVTVSWIAGLLVSVALLPLFPFHAGHVACVMRLPGNLPAFLTLSLPIIGVAPLLHVLPTLPDGAWTILGHVALVSMLYGSVRAVGRPLPLSLLAHASLAFYSILWWFVASTGNVSPSVSVYLAAVGLSTAGLYVGWYAIRARFGELDTRALGGLVQPMPRLAVLFSLLAVAALGLPPFGVFSGFMGLLLTPDLRLPGSFAVVALVWLAASWYYLEFMRRLLFGPTRADLRYEDVRETEVASMTIVLVLLAILGILPSRWFDAGSTARPVVPTLESSIWKR